MVNVVSVDASILAKITEKWAWPNSETVPLIMPKLEISAFSDKISPPRTNLKMVRFKVIFFFFG